MTVSREVLWLWAVMAFRPGNKRIWELSANYDDIEEFVKALKEHQVTEVTDKEYSRIDSISFDDAEKVIEVCKEKNINIYCYESEGYPLLLKRIANPPAMLFTFGNLDFINDKCVIVVVGSRKPSEYSVEITHKLGRELTERNFLLASGFAEGIDREVNQVSVECKSFPIAVCAAPLDMDSPKDSSDIKENIGRLGVVISEYYPGSERAPNAFVNRNRILVGISKAVLFIEAGRESHGLDNVNHAVYQGKSLFVVPPHDIYDKRYFGQRDLIRNECQPIFGAEDIVYSLAEENGGEFGLAKSLGDFTLPAEDSGFFYEEDKNKVHRKLKSRKSAEQADIGTKSVDYSSLNDEQAEICRLLEKKNMLADEISAVTGKNISEPLSALTELEINGVVKSFPGKMFGI